MGDSEQEVYILETEIREDFDEKEQERIRERFAVAYDHMPADEAGVIIGAGDKDWKGKGWKTLDREATPGEFDFHHVAQAMPLTMRGKSMDYVYAEYALVRGGMKLSELAFATRQVLKNDGVFVIDTSRITDEGNFSGPMRFPFGFDRISDVESELRNFGFKCFSSLSGENVQQSGRSQKVRFYCMKNL